jgi:hypothetical protein
MPEEIIFEFSFFKTNNDSQFNNIFKTTGSFDISYNGKNITIKSNEQQQFHVNDSCGTHIITNECLSISDSVTEIRGVPDYIIYVHLVGKEIINIIITKKILTHEESKAFSGEYLISINERRAIFGNKNINGTYGNFIENIQIQNILNLIEEDERGEEDVRQIDGRGKEEAEKEAVGQIDGRGKEEAEKKGVGQINEREKEEAEKKGEEEGEEEDEKKETDEEGVIKDIAIKKVSELLTSIREEDENKDKNLKEVRENYEKEASILKVIKDIAIEKVSELLTSKREEEEKKKLNIREKIKEEELKEIKRIEQTLVFKKIKEIAIQKVLYLLKKEEEEREEERKKNNLEGIKKIATDKVSDFLIINKNKILEKMRILNGKIKRKRKRE